MLQTFSGYFQEGRFISSQTTAIPEYVEVVIVVTDKPIVAINSQSQALVDADSKTMSQYLDSTNNPRLLREPDPSKSTMLGQWNGEVKIPDDFDEPLEEMKEYMY